MKNVLVIGSTVVDVIINVERLPRTQEDVHVLGQRMSLGGCAYNVSDMIRHFGVPYLLFSPVGAGAYGEFVRAQLSKRRVSTPIPAVERENGCCYCFVEANGERTFISYHGAEYLFEREWFELTEPSEIDSVYICGLEIEETTGVHIVDYLEEHPEYRIYFAPGPRITKIAPELLARLFDLHPVLHLNEEEVLAYARSCEGDSGAAVGTCEADGNSIAAAGVCEADCESAAVPEGCEEDCKSAGVSECEVDCESAAVPGNWLAAKRRRALEEAARLLHARTGNDVIVTLGADGTFYRTDAGSGYVPAAPAAQIDAIGAGDSHIGAVIACEKLGLSLPEAIRTANRVAAKVVETEGALLPDEAFAELKTRGQSPQKGSVQH